jgi:hypothetical protein
MKRFRKKITRDTGQEGGYIRIICPHCHTRCRLQQRTGQKPVSQGKCPECGKPFPIPPGIRSSPEKHPKGKSLPARLKTTTGNDSEQPATPTSANKVQSNAKKIIPEQLVDNPLTWLGAGMLLMLGIALILILAPSRTPATIATETTLPTKAATQIKSSKPALVSIPDKVRKQAITRIKEHALVGDAAIYPENERIDLALLVNPNTPPTYAERLGRQFAYYFRKQFGTISQPVPPLEVSVYYPTGTRIKVAVSHHNGEEEVLPEQKQSGAN